MMLAERQNAARGFKGATVAPLVRARPVDPAVASEIDRGCVPARARDEKGPEDNTKNGEVISPEVALSCLRLTLRLAPPVVFALLGENRPSFRLFPRLST